MEIDLVCLLLGYIEGMPVTGATPPIISIYDCCCDLTRILCTI